MLDWYPVIGLLLIACLTDLLYRKIPNALLLVAGAYGLISSAMGFGNVVIMDAVLGLVIGLMIFSFPYYKSWIGAGDVKLMGVLGIYFGPTLTLSAAIYSMLAGGILALIYTLRQSHTKESLSNLVKLKISDVRMPYATAIFIGSCFAILMSRE
jgi:prepilin peptidase CpaA